MDAGKEGRWQIVPRCSSHIAEIPEEKPRGLDTYQQQNRSRWDGSAPARSEWERPCPSTLAAFPPCEGQDEASVVSISAQQMFKGSEA